MVNKKTGSENFVDEILGEGIVKTFDPGLRRAFDIAKNESDKIKRDRKKLIMKKGHFKVSGDGVFYTLQGEGISMGQPAVFLRLHFCNLKCVWCDAYYTWDPNSKEFWSELQDWSVAETVKRVKAEWKCVNRKKQKRLIITGGEPLLQKALLDNLIRKLSNWQVEIETNGTIMPTHLQLSTCQFNCSPKLDNSLNAKVIRYKPDVIQSLNEVSTTFKFVVTSPKDIDEIERNFVKKKLISVEKILLMPQGVTSEEVWQNARKIVEMAKCKGYRMLGRLHVDLWGARRKV